MLARSAAPLRRRAPFRSLPRQTLTVVVAISQPAAWKGWRWQIQRLEGGQSTVLEESRRPYSSIAAALAAGRPRIGLKGIAPGVVIG